MTATAQIPKMADDMYEIQRDGLYLIPTGEVPLTNIYRDRTLEESQLPVMLCGYTPCFRREAGSYGKDTRGLNRVHQFEKVEMVRLEHPERSDHAQGEMVDHVTGMLRELNIPYRVLLLATGDLSFAARGALTSKYGPRDRKSGWRFHPFQLQGFQARRGSMKFRPASGGKPRYLHTLNGSGLALPRLISSIVENNQLEDGGIRLPAVIAERMGVEVIR